MDLALALGRASVGRMLDEMTDRELDGWVAYVRKKGLPHMRQELYLAQVAQVQGGGKLDRYLLKPAEKVDEERVGTIEDLVGGANVIRIRKG